MIRRLMLAGLVAVGCLAQTGVPGKPAWVETLPEAPGRLYALGTAPLGGNESEAISRASDRARLEVVARLRATVRGSTSITTRTAETAGVPGAASGARQVLDQVSVGTRAEDLPGLVVERTHTDPAGGIAYALAYLDLAQAHATLAARLALARDGRLQVGGENSRKARWRLRKLQEDLGRLDELIGMMAMTGASEDLRAPLQAERTAVAKRLAQMETQGLPPLDLAKTTVGLRCNLDLPIGVEAYLGDQISACGLVHRDLNPDLILDLTFAGGTKGPEFIYVDLDVYEGVSYRLKAQLSILEGGGAALTRPVALEVSQSSSPEGMVDQFRRQFERRLPKLIAQAVAELQ